MPTMKTLLRRNNERGQVFVFLAITLVAAVVPSMQGMLLTVEGLGFFIAAMMLAPRIRVERSPGASPAAAPA